MDSVGFLNELNATIGLNIHTIFGCNHKTTNNNSINKTIVSNDNSNGIDTYYLILFNCFMM